MDLKDTSMSAKSNEVKLVTIYEKRLFKEITLFEKSIALLTYVVSTLDLLACFVQAMQTQNLSEKYIENSRLYEDTHSSIWDHCCYSHRHCRCYLQLNFLIFEVRSAHRRVR